MSETGSFRLIFCFTIMVSTLMIGCSPAQPKKPPVQGQPVSFQAKRAAFLACTNAFYEDEEMWDEMKATLNRSSNNEIQEWLSLQQTILIHYTNIYSGDSLRRSAIQEFRLLSEHAEPFRPWLEECKTNGLFKDPFIIQNRDLILERMNAKKK